MGIRFEAMPLDEEIKGNQRKGEPHLKSDPRPISDFFQMTDTMQHREYDLDQHPGIPQTTLTQFEIDGIAFFGMERNITQDDHLLFKGLDQRIESSIKRISSSPIPDHYQTPLI